MTAPQPPNIDEILIKTYRYFNGVSPWNVDVRIPEALIADKAKLLEAVLQAVGEDEEDTGFYWGKSNITRVARTGLRAEIRERLTKLFGGEI